MRPQQKGFTLIELIIVIVILGALAVVALPRFIDLQDEAEQAATEGVAGAISSAFAINYAASLTDLDAADNGAAADEYVEVEENQTITVGENADDFDVNDILQQPIDDDDYDISGDNDNGNGDCGAGEPGEAVECTLEGPADSEAAITVIATEEEEED